MCADANESNAANRNRCPVSGGFYRPRALARWSRWVRPTGRWEKCIFHAARKKNGQKRPRGARIRAARAFHRVVAAGGQPSGQPSGQPGWTGGSARRPARFGGWPGPISGVAGHSAGHLAGPLAGPRAGRRAGRGPDAPSRRPSPALAWRATRLRAIAERLRAPQASIYARLRPLAERLTNRRRSEPPACGELQTMTKRRPMTG